MQDKSLSLKIPIYTIEQLNGCEHQLAMGVDIRRLEVHLQNLEFVHFPHRHDFYNLLYITEGSGTHSIDYRTYPVVPNQLYFMAEGQVHSWELSPNSKGFTMFFTKDFYSVDETQLALHSLPFFNSLHNDPMLVFEPTLAPYIQHCFEEIMTEYETNLPYRDATIKSLLKLILIQSVRHYRLPNHDTTSAYYMARIRIFEQLIELHHTKKKGVKEYAQLMHLSPNYLNSLCTKSIGKTAGDMIRERIVLEAKRLLLHSSMSVCEIAYHLGYEDCSYFIRLFKAATRNTPEQYRKVKSEK
jgi:AraC family transcriptional regulator, transcriptional activator of pobA